MQLVAYGYQDKMQMVQPAKIVADYNRLKYLRGDIEEWYVNTPMGIEQGFTIANPPAIQSGKLLEIQIAIGCDLQLHLFDDGSSTRLCSDNGVQLLNYRNLKAIDAKGNVLPARMKVKSKIIAVYIFERNLGGTDNWGQAIKLTPTDVAAFDEFGMYLAIDNDTLAVNAIGDDDKGEGSGSAYVFLCVIGEGADTSGSILPLSLCKWKRLNFCL